MRRIDDIVVHYGATFPDQEVSMAIFREWHQKRGWKREGYHYGITRDGKREIGRPESMVGAGVANQNIGKLHICVYGGVERATGKDVGVDNRTPAQKRELEALIRELLGRYPDANVRGHNDFANTQCPGYDVKAWWASVNQPKNQEPIKSETPSTSSLLAAIVLFFQKWIKK